MKTEFNHATDVSPRSGSSKKTSAVVGIVIVVALVAIAAGLELLA